MARGPVKGMARQSRSSMLTYTKPNTNSLLTAGVKKVGKIPWGKYKDVTPKARKVNFTGLGKMPLGDINKAPGYSKMKQQIKKKGFTKNYSM